MWKLDHYESRRDFLNIKKIFLLLFLISLLFSPTIAQQMFYEERFYVLSFWIKTLGGISGGIAVIWTIIYGLRTISQRSKEESRAKMSSLLESLSSESEYARLAAAKGLTRYIDNVIDEILTAISAEESCVVRTALENALYQIKKNNMKKVIRTNSETLINRSYLFGRLTAVGVEKEQIAARLRLTSESIKTIKDRFSIDYEYGKKIQQMHMKRQEIIESNQDNLGNGIGFLFKESKIVSRLTESTGRVIARWIRGGRKIYWPETGLDLSETNLYKVELKKINASYSMFSYCLMRHSNLEKSTLYKSNFSFADLLDTCMDNANFCEANLMNCHLRSSSGKYANFSKAYLYGAIFSQSDFSNAEFVRATADKVKFRGTILTNAIFNNCSLVKSEFQEANLEGALFNETRMFGSILINANLEDSSMKGVLLNGADLRGAKFLNANLEDVDFRGANIKNVKFENCKGFNEAIFDNNSRLS